MSRIKLLLKTQTRLLNLTLKYINEIDRWKDYKNASWITKPYHWFRTVGLLTRPYLECKLAKLRVWQDKVDAYIEKCEDHLNDNQYDSVKSGQATTRRLHDHYKVRCHLNKSKKNCFKTWSSFFTSSCRKLSHEMDKLDNEMNPIESPKYML